MSSIDGTNTDGSYDERLTEMNKNVSCSRERDKGLKKGSYG